MAYPTIRDLKKMISKLDDDMIVLMSIDGEEVPMSCTYAWRPQVLVNTEGKMQQFVHPNELARGDFDELLEQGYKLRDTIVFEER